jgi:hypothetical protein
MTSVFCGDEHLPHQPGQADDSYRKDTGVPVRTSRDGMNIYSKPGLLIAEPDVKATGMGREQKSNTPDVKQDGLIDKNNSCTGDP